MSKKEFDLRGKTGLVDVTVTCQGCSKYDAGDGVYGSKVFASLPHRTMIGSDELVIEDENDNSIPFERSKGGAIQTVTLALHYAEGNPSKAIFIWEDYE